MMNRCKEAGDGFHVPRTRRAVSNYFKDKEEELSFFRDLQKRDKGDQVASLLQPIVSEEFEANGSYAVEHLGGGGRRGIEFLGEGGKSDYNWLKTPPATPLFPSLEMEAKGTGSGQELALQREIPIVHQPLSRFAAGNTDESKTTTKTTTSLSSSMTNYPKPKLPQRYKTPTKSDKRNMKTAPVITSQMTPTLRNSTKPIIPSTSKSIAPMEPSRAKTRGVSPSFRPSILSLAGSSDKTPPSLKTMSNRPASATRGRPTNPNLSTLQIKDTNKDSKMIRRQSCSPSMARGRKVDTSTSIGGDSNRQHDQVLGSQMVERFMNARISHKERQSTIKTMSTSMNYGGSSGEESLMTLSKVKLNGSSLNESSGFGRLMSRNSLDMALKHMEVKRDSSNARKNPFGPARRS